MPKKGLSFGSVLLVGILVFHIAVLWFLRKFFFYVQMDRSENCPMKFSLRHRF